MNTGAGWKTGSLPAVNTMISKISATQKAGVSLSKSKEYTIASLHDFLFITTKIIYEAVFSMKKYSKRSYLLGWSTATERRRPRVLYKPQTMCCLLVSESRTMIHCLAHMFICKFRDKFLLWVLWTNTGILYNTSKISCVTAKLIM